MNIMNILSRTCFKLIKNVKLTYYTLCYQEFLDKNYVADVLLEPLFWFIDNFTKILGPVFVIGVISLLTLVVAIAYIVGLPYYWNKSPALSCVLLVIGNWILLNVCFHFYMASSTDPGYLSHSTELHETVSICKKCIAPKPPRTHHCSICNQCVLKMDHHCPWLNNCIGHYNHRYFFLFCFYTSIGAFFLMCFGAEIFFIDLYGNVSDVAINESQEGKFSTNIFMKCLFYIVRYLMGVKTKDSTTKHANNTATEYMFYRAYHVSIMFETVLTTAVFVALGALTLWHLRLILNGETSIEKHINAKQAKRMRKKNKVFNNPYNFGKHENLKIFLGVENNRSWFWHVFIPSKHKPEGNGMSWKKNYSHEFQTVSSS